MGGAKGDPQVGFLSWMRRVILYPIARRKGCGEVSYSCEGDITEFPDRSETPIDRVRQAAKEFLASGGQLPTCVERQVPEFW
ncbi:Imm1 family immunity protein [Streptomyces sp. NPDC001307]|uniref:Imm1 family immunity protein n=1 Tax=Streptomyces sp. NPDC001307 TaxID=3364560 RepID=UPI0036899687